MNKGDQWQWEGGLHLGRHCAGMAFGENKEFWNFAASGEMAFALQNGVSGFINAAARAAEVSLSGL